MPGSLDTGDGDFEALVDWSEWPVLRVMASEVATTDAPHIVITALQAALAREEPFAAILQMPVTRRERGSGGAAERVRMLKTIRPALAQRCRGLAFIVPDEAREDLSNTIRAASKVWGCPTTATDNYAVAQTWARTQLTTPTNASGMPDGV